MKHIVRYASMLLIAAIAFWGCSPQEFDDYQFDHTSTLKGKEGEVHLTVSPSTALPADLLNSLLGTYYDDESKNEAYFLQWSREFTVKFDFNVLNNPVSYSVDVVYDKIKTWPTEDVAMVTESTTLTYKTMEGSFFLEHAKAGNYTATLSVYAGDGTSVSVPVPIVITIDFPEPPLPPIDYKAILTGGANKTWIIKEAFMSNPGNYGDIWWNPYNESSGSMADDSFTFRADGSFVYSNAGTTFMNESLGTLFPDGDPIGSFVTEHYTPADDATWSMDRDILVLTKAFMGYAVAPEDLEGAMYQIYSITDEEVRMVYYPIGGVAWHFVLGEGVSKMDMLTGGTTNGKAWVVDGYNKHVDEVKAGIDPSIAAKINGFMGLGPLNGGYQEWWPAAAGNKGPDDTEAGWKLYETKHIFKPDGKLVIETQGEGYGRNACAAVGGFTVKTVQGEDMIFDWNGGTYDFNLAGSQLTISDNGFLAYYAGTQEYEVIYLSETALCVRVLNTIEGQDWVFILCPEGEQ